MDDAGAWWSEVASPFLFGVRPGLPLRRAGRVCSEGVVYASSPMHWLAHTHTLSHTARFAGGSHRIVHAPTHPHVERYVAQRCWRAGGALVGAHAGLSRYRDAGLAALSQFGASAPVLVSSHSRRFFFFSCCRCRCCCCCLVFCSLCTPATLPRRPRHTTPHRPRLHRCTAASLPTRRPRRPRRAGATAVAPSPHTSPPACRLPMSPSLR